MKNSSISETWAMKVEDTQKLKRTDANMMRRMCGLSLKKHLSNKALRGRLGIDCISDLVRRSRLRWFGHVIRKDDQLWVRKCMDFKVDSNVGSGRPRKSWLECVNDDMKRFVWKKRWHTIGLCGSRLFMGMSKLCKLRKYDVKRIDT